MFVNLIFCHALLLLYAIAMNETNFCSHVIVPHDIIQRAQRARADAKKGRDAYYANREKTTQRMREKTPKGQPVLANQIKMMLGKIKEEVKENKTRAPVQRWGGRGGRKAAGRGTTRGVKKGTSSSHK